MRDMTFIGISAPAITMDAGRPWPLGASWDGAGVNFAVFSDHARGIELCLFDDEGRHELSRTLLPSRSNDVLHGYLTGARPGLVYGLRAHGPWRPDRGERFNPHKLLLDPYARAIVGRFEWRPEHFDVDRDHAAHMDTRDNAAYALKARVVARADNERSEETRPYTPLAKTVLYELHVKGFTQLHPDIPPHLRGTFAGLASDAAIAHLKSLNVTAVNLMPVHQHLDEQRLAAMGLSNYWGYNTLGFFSPEPTLTSGTEGLSASEEFRAMVDKLHKHGLEVILDVVYNHTAESDENGPTISFRGLDNSSYYRPTLHSRWHYENYTGCGNTLDMRHPRVLQLVMDSLRYWAGEMHVDGFRFDLAPVLGRGDHGFSRNAHFFTAIAQDPLLSRLKMIAEPWDLGPDGYQLGGFPSGWLEWNDRFRDTMRAFWVLGDRTRGDFSLSWCASSDIFAPRGRTPAESINYIASHDGFTLRDLLTYSRRHNEANGENNRDGHSQNHSFNCGEEGPTTNPNVNALRGRLQRALLASTLLSQGTPMLTAGDEFGHTQGGNNNPYCQDNPTTWLDWTQVDQDLLAYTRRVLALRRQALPLTNVWYDGLPDRHGLQDLSWFGADGEELQSEHWRSSSSRVLGCLFGRPRRGLAPLLLLINGGDSYCPFQLPAGVWHAVLDSTYPRGYSSWTGRGPVFYPLGARSVVVLSAAANRFNFPQDS